MSQPHINGNINCFNNDNSVSNVWNNCTVVDEKSEILAWLSPLEPQIRHHDIQSRRIDNVGDWLIQTEEYRNWFGGIGGGDSSGSALFCHGGPGIGKTFISSVVIDALCKQAVEGNAALACFYFDFAAQEQSLAAILGSVLKQVVGGLDEVPEKIVNAFRTRGKAIGRQMLALSEIVECLEDISSSRCTFICIDALDECPSGHRINLLDSLNQILQKSPGARIFMTGRPHILGEVEKHLGVRAATRSITPTKNDIITFLRAKLKEDTMPGAMDESLEQEIIQNIPEAVSEIFLLAFLSIETILQETTIYSRRQRLRAMNNGLDLEGAYGATLGRIKAQGGEKARLGMAVLMWISHSGWPLRVGELCHAIAIRIGSIDLNSDGIPAISTVLSCCQGLVTMEKGVSTVRFIHFTLQEYLCTSHDLFDRAHSTMAETCLTYLNLQHIKDLSAGPPPDPRSAPFLEYSSLYWGTHMRMELSDRARISALELLDQFDRHISAKSLWKSINGGLPWYCHPGEEPFSALHCISYFGIAEVARILIKMNRWDVNQKDGAGMTPLIWAAQRGHEEVVKLLLRDKHIQPDHQDTNFGRNALSWAAGNGHDGVVGLFLGLGFANPGSIGRQWEKAARVVNTLFGGRYVNPNSTCNSGRTPLLWATQNSHEGIVKLLLGRGDVNPNIPDRTFCQTPLLWATENGHEEIVKLLLRREDVNPNIPGTTYDQTPLLWAAKCGREEIVKLLLNRKDVNPNSPCQSGQTPLLWAAENGHQGIVELLLGREDVNPDIPDTTYGQTPLSSAAEKGHEGIVRLLLGRKDINPNIPDTKYGRTPLSRAAAKRHEGAVKLLLGRKDVNPNSSCQSGRTPLLWAAKNGQEGIVKLLLEREDINPNIPDTEYGQTPLSWAAAKRHEGAVKLLLGRKDVNPNRSCQSGRTPLLWAAGNGQVRIVKLLLGREDVNPDIQETKYGQTPLSWAAAKGHEGAVKLLLGRKDVNPNRSCQSGRTPLLWATGNGHEGSVKLLLGREDVNPDIPDTRYGQAPLSLAAEKGYEGIAKLLLGREDVNPDIQDTKYGQTPLFWAAKNGHEGTVKLLLGREDTNPDIPDTKYGQTPLLWAAKNGHEGIVKLLLERKDLSPDTELYRGPLEWAAVNGHEGIVKLLLEREDLSLDNEFYRDLLFYAAMDGHEGIVKLLLEREDLSPDSELYRGLLRR